MSSPPSPAAVALALGPPIDEVAEILGCREGGRQVGEFLRDRAPALVLDALARVLDGDVGRVRCTVTRSKLKPHRRLTLSAELHGLGAGPRPVSAVWGAQPDSFADHPGARVVPASARGPFTSLRVASDGGSSAAPTLLVAPLDPAFPSLAALHDPEYLAALLRTQQVEVGLEGHSLTTLRYRPGQRHVLRIDLGESGRSIYAKCYRDDTGARAVAARHRVAAALRSGDHPVEPVQPVGYVEAERVMFWEGSAGARLGESVEGLSRHLRAAGAGLRAIHDSPVVAEEGPLRSDPDRERAATLRSCEHVIALLPDTEGALTALADRAADRAAREPTEAGHLLHGDFKCDNALVEQDDRLRLLDLDRVTLGDPALDLGKMISDLGWWAVTRGVDAEPFVDSFLDGYGACPRHRMRRAGGYADLFLLRSIGRRIPLHESGWDDRVERMLAVVTRGGGGR
ncbi:phosphotransferase [Nostocoides sp. F2B08]|uniref:phosphotransferase n=1 Tax=Nostocoides sp. F2B08 TaxID=2653936 RepID=UPI001263CA33|nr:phosphotransferase [Tetrasphaera sp. F2B08]KAB7746398.1 phosphotransferase [Tetrasphaera sp. F2B08]